MASEAEVENSKCGALLRWDTFKVVLSLNAGTSRLCIQDSSNLFRPLNPDGGRHLALSHILPVAAYCADKQ